MALFGPRQARRTPGPAFGANVIGARPGGARGPRRPRRLFSDVALQRKRRDSPALRSRTGHGHRGRADDAGDEAFAGVAVGLRGRAKLLDPAGARHDNLVDRHHRLDLVSGETDHGRADGVIQLG
jgi:hypothetical protein